MEQERYERLAEVMSRIAAGERAALFILADEFGEEIGRAMRRHLACSGMRLVPRAEVEALTIDACFELERVAGAWRPEYGTPPWAWARARLRRLAQRHIGQWTEEFDPEEVELGTGRHAVGSWAAPGPSCEPDLLDLLGSAAERQPLCRLLRQALAETVSPRDQAILLDVAVQQSLGDRSAAVTVARLHGMRPEAVRQVWCRVRRRLRELAAGDDRYAPLSGVALLAA